MTHNGHDVYGFIPAINAYRAIKNWSNYSVGLVLCISDSSNLHGINELHRFATEIGVDNDIYWLIGGLKGIRMLWVSSDVYIRPTSTDGDSVSIRDALAEGVVVVASDVCERPEGVLVYQYGNYEDFIKKLKVAMSEKRNPSFNLQYYEEMKRLYSLVLAP